MKTVRSILFSFSFILIFTSTIYSQNQEKWNMFRGPNGSGLVETGDLPGKISPSDNLLWRVDMPTGYSSPVLSDEYIFLTGEDNGTLYTYCMSREDGRTIWKAEAPRPRKEKLDNRNNAASPSVVTDGESVFVFFADFGLLAYDYQGQELWQHQLGPFNNVYGMGASPILTEDLVILVCDQNLDSFIIAVNKESGEIVWKKERPEATSGHSTPILYQPDGGQLQILVPGSFKLTSYDAASGNIIWWVDGLSFEMKSTPVIWKNMVFINGYATPMNQLENQRDIPTFEKALSEYDKDKNKMLSQEELPREPQYSWFSFVDLRGDGELDLHDWNYFKAALASLNGMLGIKLGGEGDMTGKSVVWTYHKSIPQLPSPLIYEDVLYMINDGGYVTTFNPATGDIMDEGRLPKGGTHFYASPVGSDGKIYILSRRGKVSILESGGKISPAFQADMGEMCFATPAISKGRIYLRTDNTLYCFGKI